MGLGDIVEPTKDILAPTGQLFGGGLRGFAQYAWVFFIVVFIVAVVGVVYLIKMWKKKKTQWTHKLKVRRVLQNGQLTDPIYMNMRRFPLIKRAEVFELEKPLLGGYLIPELDQYSGENEFSIILDTNNRIYTNTGEFFKPDKNAVNVSAKHSEIDIQRSNLKADFQNINKVTKRVQWAEIAKYAMLFTLIVAVMVVSIVAISKWGNSKEFDAQEAQANAQAMDNLAKAMVTIQATVNTQKLEILPMMKEIYKTQNLQGIIKTPTNETS